MEHTNQAVTSLARVDFHPACEAAINEQIKWVGQPEGIGVGGHGGTIDRVQQGGCRMAHGARRRVAGSRSWVMPPSRCASRVALHS